MGKFIPDEVLDRIRQATDIVSLVRESLPLKKAGSAYKALCPFHREKTPSFHVNPERQIFKCFGCGAGGDVFSFLMKTEGLTFAEAAAALAERAHIRLPTTATGNAPPSDKALLHQVNGWAAQTFHHWLVKAPLGKRALQYLLARGVTTDTVERFQLGYAPEGWDGLLKAGRSKSYSPELMARAGLLSSSQDSDRRYDRFRNRLMFPISDVQGRAIAFGARALDESEPKYLNSPETPLFAKGRVLYGLHAARAHLKEKRQAVVVEGYMDVIMLYQHGITHAIGVLGTALTRDHVRLLRRYVDEAVLVFDADDADQKSANRSLDAFAAEELAVRVAVLPDGLDPDEFVRRRGAETFLDGLRSARDGIRYKLNRLLAAIPADRAESSLPLARALDDVLATVALMPNAVAQSLEVRTIAEQSGVAEQAVRDRLSRIASRQRFETNETATVESSVSGRQLERELLQAMLAYPETVGIVRPGLDANWLGDRNVRTLIQRLFDLSDSGLPTGPAELLARTQEPPLRETVERIIGLDPIPCKDPETWCRKLLDELEARTLVQTAARLHSEVSRGETRGREDEDRALMAKLNAAREAQRKRGRLHR